MLSKLFLCLIGSNSRTITEDFEVYIYISNCRDVHKEAFTGTMGIAERIVKKVYCAACDIFAEF